MDLDEYQEAARLNQDEKVLLVAPPGSGKTTVLLAKIKFLMTDLNFSPKEILVLTFSRSASVNMRVRFEQQRLVAPFFGTIHAFAWQEIRRHRKAMEISTDAQALAALSEIRTKYSLSPEEIAAYISDISRERSTGVIDESIPVDFRLEVRSAYQDYKDANGLLDFDDLEEELLHLFEEEGFLGQIQERYRWILVDEFQDLNRVQLNILKLIAKRSHLFCVGDEDQCIYAFRGSDTSAMIHFPDEFNGGRILYLKYNYRSSATVVAYANAVIRHNQERYPKEISNYRQDQTNLELIQPLDEIAGLGVLVTKLSRSTFDQTNAVIVRTNGELEEIAHYLVKHGIRFGLLDRVYNKYQKQIYRTLIDYLHYANGGSVDAKQKFLKIIRRPGVGLSRDILQRLETQKLWIEQDLLDDQKFDLTGPQREALIGWFRDVGQLKKMKPTAAVRYILYVMGYYRYLEQLAKTTGASFQGLIQEVESFATEAGRFLDTTTFLRYITAFDEICQHPDDESRILLSTMHGVKGMEFDQVYVLNVIEGKIPHEKAFHEIEAERRLYYVAVTRARHELTVLSPRMYLGKPATPSRFLLESAMANENFSRILDDPASHKGTKKRKHRFFGKKINK